jgi:hypothetical protein
MQAAVKVKKLVVLDEWRGEFVSILEEGVQIQ